MQRRLILAATALQLGLLTACPALAQSAGSASAGSGSVSATSASVTPPEGVPAVPKLDLEDALAERAIDFDADAAVASAATVTRTASGETTVTEPSEEMKALVAAEYESQDSLDEVSRAVVGTDDRVQVTNSADYYRRVVGWLYMVYPNGEAGTCSGTLIGPASVITAAHCVYDHDGGGWATDVWFYPGATSLNELPFGGYQWADANILRGFIDNYQDNYGSVLDWDLAVITLQPAQDGVNAGDALGWMGFKVDDGSEFSAEILGYPGDKPEGTMWQSTCTIPTDYFYELFLLHPCDTFAGSSGSSMFVIDADGLPYIRAVNVAEDDTPINYGVRLTPAYYDFVAGVWK
jgi:V8-like Glu-specific endopeptidase